MLMSLVRWVLTGGRGAAKQGQGQPASAAATAGSALGTTEVRRRHSLNIFLYLFQWMAWPFTGLERLISRGARRRSGGRSRKRERAVLRPEPLPKQQQRARTSYPRPQSTAYPRPQSTAYPRPRVTTRTLLGIEVERNEEVLRPRAERLALAEAGDEEALVSAAVTKDPLWSRFLVWFFERVITSRANLVEGLQVNVDARSNREAMSGLLQSVGITFNHLELETLQISGGARMNIIGLDLKVMTLLWKRFNSFKKPFEVRELYESGGLCVLCRVFLVT